MIQYKLVPVKPTVDMTIAGMTDSDGKKALFSDHANFVYSQMIAAAPPYPDPYKALEIAREALDAARTILFPKTTSGEIVLSWDDVRVVRDKLGDALHKIDEVMK